MIETLYAKLPIFLQNLACTVYGIREKNLRFNEDFEKFLSEYLSSQYQSKQQISENEQAEIRRLLAHCSEHVPYYSQLMQDLKVDSNAEDIYAELKKLPVLTKEMLRKSQATLVATNSVPENRVELHTSGTTGKALTLFRDKLSISKQWALCYRHRARFGCKFGDLHVNFTGKLVVPTEQVKPPFWRHNKAFNQYLVNMQHINAKNIVSIVAFLNSLKPRFYSGYPSIIAEVSRLAMDKGLQLEQEARPSVVFAGAENTLDYQKSMIEQWTGAQVTDLYGLTEGNCHLSRCEEGYYHIDHEYGFVECVDQEPLSGGRARGKLVGTAFTTQSMPLVRYDTGDMAIWMPEDFQCKCGRHGRVLESIEGRVDDFVELNDGRRIMRFDYLFKGTDIIKEAQVCQFEKGKVHFKLVLREDKRADIEKELTMQFRKWISDDMELSFEYLDKIPRSNTGKFKAVQSFL